MRFAVWADRCARSCALLLTLASPLWAAGAAPGDPYIVLLRADLPAAEIPRIAGELVYRNGGQLDHVYREGLKGFAARLPALAASGIRRDPRVIGLESLVDASPVLGGSGAAMTAPTSAIAAGETEAGARAPVSKVRRVLTPAADRYVITLANASGDVETTADRLGIDHGIRERGPVEAGVFRASMAEAVAVAISRDPRVASVQEQSISEPMDPAGARHTPRQLPGQGLRRVAGPLPDQYRVVLRATVPDEQLDATVDELLRAYEGKRRAIVRDDPRVLLVEMTEPAARALSDDFRVDFVEERSAAAPAASTTAAR